MEQKKDLRVIKTKKSIYEALFKIMENKSFEEIRVSEICEVALINRSTFYSHFEDKYELLDAMIEDLKDSFLAELTKMEKPSNLKQYYINVITLLLDYIDAKKTIYVSMLLNNKNSIAVDMLYSILTEEVEKHLRESNPTDIPAEFLTSYYIGALFNVGITWLKSNDAYSKEEVIKYIDELIPNN